MRDKNERRQEPPHKRPCPPDNDDNCKENDTVTQNTINTERKLYCAELDAAAGSVYQWEENYAGWKLLKKKKKCLFIWSEKNYQVFRNLQISTGVSLLQYSDSIKDSTAAFLKLNKTLSEGLKDVLKKVKEAKAKINELNTEAGELRRCVHEGCNCTQWGILTGDWSNCKEKKERKRPPDCDDIEKKFERLFCLPDAIAKDAHHVFKAAADVVGIQVFSNIATLENLQKTLGDSTKAFDKHLQDTVKKNQDEAKKMQEEFVKSVTEFSKSRGTLYSKRSEFEGLLEAAGFFCCPGCGCVVKNDDCKERLHDCKDLICDICEEVKDTFCTDHETTTNNKTAH